MKARAAVILIENDNIALVERYRAGKHYFVFPGGKIEVGETPAAAAKRETLEELGVVVEIGRMVAEAWYLGTPQYYFLARKISGDFGTGTGKEMGSAATSKKGYHHPLWVAVRNLPEIALLPVSMADYVIQAYHKGWPDELFVLRDSSPDKAD